MCGAVRPRLTSDYVLRAVRGFGLEPRDYQSRIISAIHNSFLDGFSSILIESPTGSGKTLMGLVTLRLLQETIPDISFGWVAMRSKLLAQAAEENKRTGVRDIQFVSMFDKTPPKCDMIITDEAQHDAAATMANLHKTMGAKWSLGMTATPFRTDRIKLSYQKVIRDCGVRFLIEGGYLSPFDQFAMSKWTPEEVAKQLISDPQRWGKSVVFFRTQEECWELHEYLQRNGVSSAVMLGSDSPAVRENVFDAFDDGSIQVLINIQLLTEGFDCPNLKTVWVRDSNKLTTMQMAGRVLRKDPDNHDKVAQIVQSSETSWPYPKCVKVKPRRQFLCQDEQWLALNPSDRIEEVIRKVRERVHNKPVLLPAYLCGSAERVVSVSLNKHGNIKTQRARDNKVNYLSYEDLTKRKEN